MFMYPHCKNSRPHDLIKAIKYHYGTSADGIEVVRRVLMYHNGVSDASALKDRDVLGCVLADLEHTVMKHCPSFHTRFMFNLQDGLHTFGYLDETKQTTVQVILYAYLHTLQMTNTTEIESLLPLPECDPDLQAYLVECNVTGGANKNT